MRFAHSSLLVVINSFEYILGSFSFTVSPVRSAYVDKLYFLSTSKQHV
jgi:hypothetical protein